MNEYLRWALWQLYLLVFWPTRSEREAEAEKRDFRKRLRYMGKMLPWMLLLAVGGALLAGYICQAFGLHFEWSKAWFGVAFGVVGGMVVGVAFLATVFRLPFYGNNLLLSVIAYSMAKQTGAAKRAWRICPVSWNEVIWLPLPYVGQLLVLLVDQDRNYGFEQIAFVAAERELQHRAALFALQEIAVRDLRANSFEEMALAPEKMAWMVGSTALELPDALTSALPGFERMARHIGQYRTLHSPYRKAEALKLASTELTAVRNTLIAKSDAMASRLLQVANAWNALVQAEQKSLQAQVEAIQEIPNPFVFGNAIPDSATQVFIGRQDIAEQIESSILGATHAPMLLLFGPRRMGKTSILKQLPRLLGNDFAPAILDCQNPAIVGSSATLLRYLSRTLSAGLHNRRVDVEPLTSETLAQEPFAAFDAWLDRVDRAMPPKLRALLCLDEYERLQETLDAGWGGKTLDMLRHTLQHRPRIILMFTRAHTFAELGPAWTDRFISARRVRVSFLTMEEVRPLLTAPIPEFDMTYAEGALEVVLYTTHGHPFLTQAVAYELVEHLNRQQRKQATCEDVEAAIAAALQSGGEYFANVWSDAKPEGQAILRAIAHGETALDYPQARIWLRDHDVLTNAGLFAVPMMERWVRENR